MGRRFVALSCVGIVAAGALALVGWIALTLLASAVKRTCAPAQVAKHSRGGLDGKDYLQYIVLDLGHPRLSRLHGQLFVVVRVGWRRHLNLHGPRLSILARWDDAVWAKRPDR